MLATPAPHMPTASVEMVSPDTAAQWLAQNTINRNIRNSLVRTYARDMAAGNWQLTGEAIKFDTDGCLRDGQHRLNAVIQSGATVPMFVIRGIAPEAQSVMDTGAKRTAGDALALRGYKNASTLAASARLALNLEQSGRERIPTHNTMFTHSEVADYIEQHPDLSDAVSNARSFMEYVDLQPSAIAVAWWMFSQRDPEACRDFFTAIANNSTKGPGDPRNTLLRRIAAARRSGESISRGVALYYLVRSWNAWRAGEDLHVLKAKSGTGNNGEVKPMPMPRAM